MKSLSLIIIFILTQLISMKTSAKENSQDTYFAGDDIYLDYKNKNRLEFIHPFGKIISNKTTDKALIDSSLTKMSGEYLIQSSKGIEKKISIHHLKPSTLNIISSASIIDVTKDGMYSIHAFSLDKYSNITDKNSSQFSIDFPSGKVISKSCDHYNLTCFTKIGNLKKSGVVTIKAETSSIKSDVSLIQQTPGPVFSYKISSKKRETINLKEDKFLIKLDNITDRYQNPVANGTKVSLIVFSEDNISQTIQRMIVEGSTSFYFTASNDKKIVKIQITSNQFKSQILYEEFI